jgi:hypothetical protein
MERQSIIVAMFRQQAEILDGLGRLRREEFNFDGTFVGLDDRVPASRTLGPGRNLWIAAARAALRWATARDKEKCEQRADETLYYPGGSKRARP